MIEFRDVSKQYPNGVIGLNHVTLNIEQGEFVAIIGLSGAGKSTMIRTINRMIDITGGQLVVDGVDVMTLRGKALRRFRRKIGMIFQSFNLVTRATVIKNVLTSMVPDMDFFSGLFGIFTKKQKLSALEALDKVGILEKAYTRCDQLSGGQQQRVALARALVAEPALLLLDEPLSNLDAKLRESMRFEIKEIQREYGITVVYVTHDQTEAMAMSDRIVVINRGIIQQIGAPKEIYNHPTNPFVADFVGKIEFLEGEVQAGRIQLDGCGQMLPYEGALKGRVIVGIRPEHVKYVEDGQGTLRGAVKSHFYLGDVDDCRIDLGGGKELRVIADPYDSMGVQMGKNVSLNVRNFLVYPEQGPGNDFRKILT